MEKRRTIHVDGVIETDLSADEWCPLFIIWLESRGEVFGGGLRDTQDEE